MQHAIHAQSGFDMDSDVRILISLLDRLSLTYSIFENDHLALSLCCIKHTKRPFFCIYLYVIAAFCFLFSGLMDMLTNYLEEYDGIVLLRPGPTIKYFAVADHTLVEYLCNSRKVIKSKRYRLFVKWLGMGLFTFTTECKF